MVQEKEKTTKAGLNSVLKAYQEATAFGSPAARRILLALRSWTNGFELNKIHADITGKLNKSLVEKGEMTFEYMKGVDIQPKRKLDMLLQTQYITTVKDGEVIIKIHVMDDIIELKKSIFTDYYFEAILVWGNLMRKNGLRVDSEESKLYPRGKVKKELLELKLTLPTKKEPWMVLLKAGCLESKIPVLSARHYGMKVVEEGVG